MEEIENLAKKEIEKMEEVFKNLKLIDEKATEIYNLALSYFLDAKYFLEKKDFLRAFEAVVISWAYIDCCLHLKFLEISDELKRYFTV
ncbi:MAG: DUF357 domain-containing protein [Candidatus Aenigmatarchaeota archaeon]|jgi:hypothetical protein